MSVLIYIASDYPLEERPIPHERLVSVHSLAPEEIHTLMESNVWETFHDIPVQYRIVITRE